MIENQDTMTTEQVANLLYPLTEAELAATSDQRRNRRKRRLGQTTKALNRAGIIPLPGRADDGQRLWASTVVLTWIKARPGKGNRTRGETLVPKAGTDLVVVPRLGNPLA